MLIQLASALGAAAVIICSAAASAPPSLRDVKTSAGVPLHTMDGVQLAAPPPAPSDFEWIRAIERGPPGRRYVLNASTYLIDRQYQLPPRTEIVGAGSDHAASGSAGMTVIKGVGPAYSSTCGANAKNRKGLLLGDHTYVTRLHFVGTDTGRYRLDPPNNDLCGGAPIETPGCAGGNGYAAPPVDCGGDTGIGRGVTNATVEDVSVAAFTYQVAFFASPTKKGVPVTTGLTIRNYRSGGTYADGINIHGAHRDVLVEGCDIALTGDDCFAIWSIGALADNISFVNNVCSHRCGRCPAPGQHGAGICQQVCNHLLPSGMVKGFGCYAVYGGKVSAIINNTGEDCSTQGNNAMVTFGYGNAGHPTMPTCFGGVFSNESTTTVTGNVGGNQSETKRACVFYERRCPFPRGGGCTPCYNSSLCNFTNPTFPLRLKLDDEASLAAEAEAAAVAGAAALRDRVRLLEALLEANGIAVPPVASAAAAAGTSTSTSAARSSFPQPLQTVTWLYTVDLDKGSRFVGDVLGWPLVLDQGSCRIYSSGRDSFLGVCDSRPPPDGDMAPVTYTLALPTREAVDLFYASLVAMGEQVRPTVPAFSEEFNVYSMFFFDPDPRSLGLYRFEVQTFEDPSWPIPSGQVAISSGTGALPPKLTCTLPGWCEPQPQRVLNVTHDLQYGAAAGQVLLLDLYAPTGRPRTPLSPAIVVIHGGGFHDGGKNESHIVRMSTHFAQRGFVVAAIDYRLLMAKEGVSGRALLAALEDTRAAVRWLVRHSASLGVDATKVASFGESAGAITSTALPYVDTSSTPGSGNPGYASNVSCAVSLSGFLTTKGLPEDVKVAIGPDSPALLEIHGTADPSIPMAMAEITAARLAVKGAAHWLVKIPGGVHEPYAQLWNRSLGFGQQMFGFLVRELQLG